jgi:hypothetical protein
VSNPFQDFSLPPVTPQTGEPDRSGARYDSAPGLEPGREAALAYLTVPHDMATGSATGRRLPGTGVAAAIVALFVAVAGLMVGWLWSELAPRIALIKTESGFIYAEPEPEQAVAADGWFVALGAGTGLAFGVLGWFLLRRHRGVAILGGLVVGSLAGAWLAWWFWRDLSLADFARLKDSVPVGARVDAPLGLRIVDEVQVGGRQKLPVGGVLAVQALVAAFAYTCLAGFSSHGSLRRPDPVPPEAAPPDAFADYTWPTDQFGPGRTGSSDSATGTART